MKKSIFLIIALFVVGLTVAYSQDYDKIDRLSDELGVLADQIDAQGGMPTPQQQQRMQQLQQELIQAYTGSSSTTQQQMQQTEEQRQQGWPPTAAWNFIRITLRQPTGVSASYVNGKPATGNTIARNEWEGFDIYITGGNLDSAFQNLKQQIESAIGERMNGSGDSLSIGTRPPNNNYTNTTIHLRLIRGTRESQLELTFRTSTLQ